MKDNSFNEKQEKQENNKMEEIPKKVDKNKHGKKSEESRKKRKTKKNKKRKSTIFVECEIDLKFRKIAASKFNFSQGWYTKAVNEAFKEWVDRNEEYFKLN